MWRVVLVVAACGRVGFAPLATDAAIDVKPSGPFAPSPVDELNTASLEDDPSLTDDRLEMVFNSDRAGGVGGADIWVTLRSDRAAPWGTPQNLAVLNSSVEESTPEISPDGLTLYFGSTRAGGAGGVDIYVSTRASRAAAFAPPTRVAELCSAQDDEAASLSRDQLVVVFESTRPGLGSADIYMATRSTAQAPFDPPILVTALSSASGEGSPFLAADSSVYLRSSRSGSSELWLAPAGDFAGLAPIAELNTTDAEDDPWVSSDGTTVYFARRNGTDWKIWTGTR